MTGVFLNLLYAVLGVAGLYYGAEFLVKGGVSIARRAGVSPLVIGLTLVAFATSAPELVVSASAAVDGNADIALGNVVGSNICNIALILGLCGCIAPMTVQRQLLRFDAWVMVGSTILLTVFYLAGNGINRIQAGIFLIGMIADLLVSFRIIFVFDFRFAYLKAERTRNLYGAKLDSLCLCQKGLLNPLQP